MAKIKEVTKNPVRAKVIAISKDGKSARVEVPTVVKDPRYHKGLRRVVSLHVHTGNKEVALGGMVDVLPSRRISKTKSWTVVSVVS